MILQFSFVTGIEIVVDWQKVYHVLEENEHCWMNLRYLLDMCRRVLICLYVLLMSNLWAMKECHLLCESRHHTDVTVTEEEWWYAFLKVTTV